MNIEIVDVRTPEDTAACHRLATAIWGAEVGCSSPQMLVHAGYGGVVLLAMNEGEAIGFLFSFPALYEGKTVLWSHETGILPDYIHQGLGYQLKLEQRKRAVTLGYESIVWTFDPLVSRNAFFNLTKLQVGIREYKVNVYGRDAADTINQGLETDRFIAQWFVNDHTHTPPFADAENSQPVGCFTLIVGPDGRPLTGEDGGTGTSGAATNSFPENSRFMETDVVYTEIPKDFTELALSQPRQAQAWREAFRHQAIGLFANDYRPAAYAVYDGRGCYSWRKIGGSH